MKAGFGTPQAMRARAYSPTLGRFVQTDPILHTGGMNLYAYVGNDPLNFVDSSGLYWRRCYVGTDGGEWGWCWVEEQTQFAGSITVDREPGVFSGPLFGPDDGGPSGTAPEEKERVCRVINARAETQSSLGPNYSNSWRWNDYEALAYDLTTARLSLETSSGINNVTWWAGWEGAGLGGIGVASGLEGLALRGSLLAAGAGAINQFYGLVEARDRARVEALTVRIIQLLNQSAGVCPAS